MRVLKFILLGLFSMHSIVIFSQENITTAIIEPLQKEALYREKVFIHTNKTTYFVNENIWFTAYVARDSNDMPSEYTTNLLVNLLDGTGKVIASKNVFTQEGAGVGDFLLDSKLESGKYYIQGFTNFMKNFGKANVYIQEIDIINQEKKAKIVDKEVLNKYDVQVFPESGYLLEGTQNSIGIKILINGRGYPFTGSIKNSQGKEVAKITGNFLGMGKSNFYYNVNESYTAELNINNTLKKIELPKAKKTGVIFEIDNEDEQKLILTLKTNTETLPNLKTDSFSLLFYRNTYISEAVTLKINNDSKISQELLFDKQKMFDGVNVVTLFKNNQPIAERKFFVELLGKKSIVFAEKLGVQNDTITYKFKTLNSSMNPIATQLSISTLPSESKVFNEKQNIKSAFLLSPYLKGNIENPSYYFGNESGNEREFLDLLLLNQGWNAYDLPKMIASINPKRTYDFEKGFTMKGSINKVPNGYDIGLLSKKISITTFSKFNKKNQFFFENIYAYKNDTVKVGLIKKDKPLVKPSKITLIESKDRLQDYSYLINYNNKTHVNETIESVDDENLNFSSKAEQLDVVKLKDIKKNSKETIYDKEANIAVKRKEIAASFYKNKKVTEQMEETFETVFDYFRFLGFVKTSTHGNIYLSLRNVSGSLFTGVSSLNPDGTPPPKVYIDNNSIMSANYESEQTDLFGSTISTVNSGGRKQSTGQFSSNITNQGIELLKSLEMTDVDEILINRLGGGGGVTGMGGTIKIYRKKGKHKYYKQQTQNLYESLVLKTGFDRAKEYYSPLYNIKTEDVFNWIEIDWSNSLKTNKEGEVFIKIPTNEFSNDFQFVINGLSNNGILIYYRYNTKEEDF
jgi:hypothetical protein